MKGKTETASTATGRPLTSDLWAGRSEEPSVCKEKGGRERGAGMRDLDKRAPLTVSLEAERTDGKHGSVGRKYGVEGPVPKGLMALSGSKAVDPLWTA